MKISKGINVRPKSGKFYVFVNHHGMRFAFPYDSQDQAETVAKAFVEAQRKGELANMVVGMKPAKPESVVPGAKKVQTLAEFYNAAMLPLWEATVVNGTAKRYGTSFRNHIEAALGNFALTELTLWHHPQS